MGRMTWTIGMLLMSANVALASSEGEGDAGIFGGSVATSVFTLIVFFLLMWILKKFAWGPLLQGLKKREELIRSEIETAKRQHQEAEVMLAEYRQKLEQVKTDAEEMMKVARDEAQEARSALLSQAYAEARETFTKAMSQVEQAKQEALRSIYRESAGFASLLAERILVREVNAEDHRVLIDRMLNELQSKTTEN